MSNYKDLQDTLTNAKAKFDRDVTCNPDIPPAEKRQRWMWFCERMRPTAERLKAIDDATDYEAVIAFERASARELRRLA